MLIIERITTGIANGKRYHATITATPEVSRRLIANTVSFIRSRFNAKMPPAKPKANAKMLSTVAVMKRICEPEG
jgi:hypothetical protein